MRLLAFLATLPNLFLFASAAPVSTGLAGGLYACEHDNFTGDCIWNPPEWMKGCQEVLFGKPINDVGHKPRSLVPDQGGHCDVFKGKACNNHTFVKRVDFPGVKNPTELPDWDLIRCYNNVAQVSSPEETSVELLTSRSNDMSVPIVHQVDTIAGVDASIASANDLPTLAGDPQPGGVYYCSDENYTGTCAWLGPDIMNQCVRLEEKFYNEDHTFLETTVPKSLNPDEGGSCDLYKERNGYKLCSYHTWIDTVNEEGATGHQLPDYDYISCCPGNHECHGP